jgi:hypothetical protein
MNLTATFAKFYAKIRKAFLTGTVYARKGTKAQSLSFFVLASIFQSHTTKKLSPLAS